MTIVYSIKKEQDRIIVWLLRNNANPSCKSVHNHLIKRKSKYSAVSSITLGELNDILVYLQAQSKNYLCLLFNRILNRMMVHN